MRGVVGEIAHTLRPPAGDRHGPLVPMMLALTLLTGIVDAVSYLRLGHVFVANMTGNVVFLGFAIAGSSAVSLPASAIAIGCFSAGAVLGGRLGALLGAHRGHLLRGATAVQAAAVALAFAIALLAAEPPAQGVRYALTAILAVAMGIQNSAAQRLAVPELTTTVLTRTLTGIASEARALGGQGAHVGRRGLAVAAMLGGAALGGLLALQASIAAALGLALFLAAAVAVAAHVASRPGAAWTRP